MENTIDNQQANAAQLTANDFAVVGGAAVDERVVSACPATAGASAVTGMAATAAAAAATGELVTPQPAQSAAQPKSTYVAPAPDPTAAAPKKGGAGYRVAKRAFDIVFSLCVCIVLAIPVVIVAIAVVIDSPGKPFFRQQRVGRGGRPIYIFKLRSMVPDAHTNPEKYMSAEQYATWKREQKLEDDPRVTRVGRFLRRTSLDEIPQFLNVLTGDISVIGPRPVTMKETYEFGNARDEVLAVRPGITGWWAVTDRNGSTWESGERQAREIFYVRHASFALDARIFAKTFKAMRRGK